jgi:5-methyltetrahydrofolate--homocysteine methyltransferase
LSSSGRINPTGLAGSRDGSRRFRASSNRRRPGGAGASPDLNAASLVDKPALLAEAVRVVQSVVETPLSIDSSIVKALEAGLAAYQGKPLVNSVTGEDERLEAVLPLVAQRGAAVIGIANDETGISEEPAVRFAVAKKIVERAESFGIPRQDVLIDPLAMPIGAMRSAGPSLFDIVRRVRGDLGVNTICGASNISFGLPDRPALNAAFLAMAIASGMTCAITNPLEESIRKAILAADVMMGHDENCAAWLAAHRGASGSAEGRGRRRERRRESGSPEA